MSNIRNKFMNRLFRRIHGLVWDLATGQIGFQTAQGVYSLTTSTGADNAVEYAVSVNVFDVATTPLPAFAMQTPFDEVEPKDVVVGDAGIIGWVIEKLPKSLRVIDHNGQVKVYSPPQVNIAGGSAGGVLVVRNLFSLAGDSGTGGAIGQLIAALVASGQDAKVEKLLPLLLAGQAAAPAAGTTGAPAAMDPMMLLALTGGLGGSGGKKDLLLPLMLSGGLGGAGAAGGMNPLLMMTLLGDDGPSAGGKKDLLLPLMMMGGMGGAASGMNPLLLMTLLGGDDEPNVGSNTAGQVSPQYAALSSGTRLPAPALRSGSGAPGLRIGG